MQKQEIVAIVKSIKSSLPYWAPEVIEEMLVEKLWPMTSRLKWLERRVEELQGEVESLTAQLGKSEHPDDCTCEE